MCGSWRSQIDDDGDGHSAKDSMYPPIQRPKLAHPTSSADRPRTMRRTSIETRPRSQRRPESERKQRPESSLNSPRKTTKGRPSTSEHHRIRNGHRTSRDFPPIEEDSEERVISRHLSELANFIEEHINTFYPIDSGSTNIPDTDDPRTRHHALRAYIARRVIDSILIPTDK